LRLLLSLPAFGGGEASTFAGGQHPVLRRLGVTGRLASGYSLPPPALQPSPVSWIKWRTRAASDVRECPLNYCVMKHVNSCWTYSDACNICRYNSSRYDSIRYTQYRFQYDTEPI